MAKSADAFRTISEVADWLGSPAHVLRFWESRFTQVKPIKRAGGRRYYRPDDMLLLGGIKKLLHNDGMTIKGVQKILKEDGVNSVAALSQPLETLADTESNDNLVNDAAAIPNEQSSIPVEEPDIPQTPALDTSAMDTAAVDAHIPDTAPTPVAQPQTADHSRQPTFPDPKTDDLDLQDDIDAFISDSSPQGHKEPQDSAPADPPPQNEATDMPHEPAPVAALGADDTAETEFVVNPVYSPQDHSPAPVATQEPPAPVVTPPVEIPALKPKTITTPADPDDDDVLTNDLPAIATIAFHEKPDLDDDAIAQLTTIYSRLTTLRDRIKSELGSNLHR